jgi:Ca-activated chloride channel family protein
MDGHHGGESMKNSRRAFTLLGLAFVGVLVTESLRDPSFWRTSTQRGDAAMGAGKYSIAAIVYEDPWHIGVAQYRNGDFKEAARTFARVPGAEGAFDMGNAQLMHGAYDAAVASYDRALSFRPGWKEAEENKALALARKAKIEGAGKDRDQEATNAYKPDEIVFDQKGDDKKGAPTEAANEGMSSDDALQATWLRRVQTTAGDFLRTKFAYQAAHEGNSTNLPKGDSP